MGRGGGGGGGQVTKGEGSVGGCGGRTLFPLEDSLNFPRGVACAVGVLLSYAKYFVCGGV